MRQNSLRDDLREATRAVHESLHLHPDFKALAEGALSREDHSDLMRRLGGFHAALDPVMEQGCARFADRIGGYRYAPRARLFLTTATHGPQPVLPGDAAALAGMAYVSDGSVLGGTLLARASADQPHPYWTFCGDQGAQVWRQTRRLIEQVDTGPKARASATAAARGLFVCFQRWVEPCLQGAA